MKINVDIKGIDQFAGKLSNLKKQVRYAAKNALNETAKKIVEAENSRLSSFFDRPTPATTKAVRLFKGATATNLEAVVGVMDGNKGYKAAEAAGTWWKGALPPVKWLSAEIVGGTRVHKRFEKLLINKRIMDAGQIAIFCKRSNALDAYGNLQGPKIVQIVSYFAAFPEAGYRSNMKSSTKMTMMKATGKYAKQLKYGMGYFRGGRNTGLPDGIWERHYPNGPAGKSFIRPIMLFVSGRGSYTRTFPFYKIAEEVVASTWDKAWGQAIAYEIATAR